MSLYGRIHVPEPLSSLARLHKAQAGEQLREVRHDPPIPVLDQQDLTAQGIRTSTFIPGCTKDAVALGSCVANAGTAALAGALDQYTLSALGIGPDPVADEVFAIGTYHQLTMATGDPATEWPPTDCGSSGLALCLWLEANGIISGHRVAHDPLALLSLLQSGGVLAGQPFLAAWEDPGPDHMVDGDGSVATIEQQIAEGVAGGHETYLTGIEQIGRDEHGAIDPFTTVLSFRNSWGSSWGDQGSALIHLSSFAALWRWCDFRALIP